MPPLKHQFLQRNRIIAAWARATWVVEAPARSGALNTASWARQLDRSCYATPSYPGDPSFSGTEKLIDEQHAEPYWGAHSLGSTWLDQTGWKKRPRKTEESVSKPNGLVGLLLQQTSRLTLQKGGTTHSELLDWATEAGYSPSEFFNALQCSFDSNHLSEKRGVIIRL
jgi:predicted Rossmann fold nucleotide-binding protein DprA/Smf involved in DNA uptake